MAHQPWGFLTSFKSPTIANMTLEKSSYIFGSSNEADADLSSLGDQISANHFTISRRMPPKDQPVFITDNSTHGTFINGELVGMGKQRILVTNDITAVSEVKDEIFFFTDYVYPPISANFPYSIASKYFVETAKLDSGAYGSVSIAHNVKTCKKFAIKTIDKWPLLLPTQETAIMRRLKHPCIIELIDVVYVTNSKFIIMELMCESLFDRMDRNNGFLPQIEIKVLFFQLAKAIKYMHSLEIVHRDLKCANIMLQTKEPYSRLKVIDFGCSKMGTTFHSYRGTRL